MIYLIILQLIIYQVKKIHKSGYIKIMLMIYWCNMFDILKNIEFKRKVYHYVNVKIYPICLKCKKEVKYKD
jgi:hypothetical protein